MSIEEFSKIYFNTDPENRDVNEWVSVLDRYIWHLVNNYSNLGDKDELFQIAWVGTMKAINTFDISKGNRFTTYLSMCISNDFKMKYRKDIINSMIDKKDKNKGYYNFCSMDAEVSQLGEDLTLHDVIQDTSSIIYSDDRYMELEFLEYCSHIKESHANMLKMYILGDKTQTDIAQSFDCPARHICRIVNNHLKKFTHNMINKKCS